MKNKNKPNAINTVSIGGVSSSIAHPREIFKPAILANASRIILGHNHPSGDPNPSKEDIKVTERILEAGDLLGINLLDHIIIGYNGFYSFKKNELI